MRDYKDWYIGEIEHRERLRNAINIPVGVLTVLVGLDGTMVKLYPFDSSIRDILFAWWVAVSLWFAVRASYFLVRAYHGHVYKTLPSPLELSKHRAALKQWHSEYGEGAAAGKTDFRKWLDHHYLHAADHNYYINLQKSEYQFRAAKAVIYCGLFAACAFAPFLIAERSQTERTYQVEIIPGARANLIGANDEQRQIDSTRAQGDSAQAGGSRAQGHARGSNH